MDKSRKRLSILKPATDSPDDTANLFDNIPAAKRRVSFSATKIVQQFHKEDLQFIHEPTNEILHLSTSAEMSDDKIRMSFNKENERNYSELELSASQGLSLLKMGDDSNTFRLNPDDTAGVFNQSSGDRQGNCASNVTDVEGSVENTESLFPNMMKQKDYTVNSIQDTMMLFNKNSKKVVSKDILLAEPSADISDTLLLFGQASEKEQSLSRPLPVDINFSMLSDVEVESSRRNSVAIGHNASASNANVSCVDTTQNLPAKTNNDDNFSFHLEDHGFTDHSFHSEPQKGNTLNPVSTVQGENSQRTHNVLARSQVADNPNGTFVVDQTFVKERPSLSQSISLSDSGHREMKAEILIKDNTIDLQMSPSFHTLLDIDVSTRFGLEKSYKEPTMEMDVEEKVEKNIFEDSMEKDVGPTIGNPKAVLSTIMETPSRPSSALIENTPKAGPGLTSSGFVRRAFHQPIRTPQYKSLPTPSSVMATPSVATMTLPMFKLSELITSHPAFGSVDLRGYEHINASSEFVDDMLIEPCTSLRFEAENVEGEGALHFEARSITARALSYYNGNEANARCHLKREYQNKLDAMTPDVERLEVLSMELDTKLEKERQLRELQDQLTNKVLKKSSEIAVQREEYQRVIEEKKKEIIELIAQIED